MTCFNNSAQTGARQLSGQKFFALLPGEGILNEKGSFISIVFTGITPRESLMTLNCLIQ